MGRRSRTARMQRKINEQRQQLLQDTAGGVQLPMPQSEEKQQKAVQQALRKMHLDHAAQMYHILATDYIMGLADEDTVDKDHIRSLCPLSELLGAVWLEHLGLCKFEDEIEGDEDTEDEAEEEVEKPVSPIILAD